MKPNVFPTGTRHQPPLDGLLCHQSSPPSGVALRWITVDHGDNAFVAGILQDEGKAALFCPGAGGIIARFAQKLRQLMTAAADPNG